MVSTEKTVPKRGHLKIATFTVAPTFISEQMHINISCHSFHQ